jgi:hypothetical protein
VRIKTAPRRRSFKVFDMKKSVDRRQVLLVLGMILFFSSIPTFLVIFTELAVDLLPSIMAGVALYFIFFRNRNQKEES